MIHNTPRYFAAFLLFAVMSISLACSTPKQTTNANLPQNQNKNTSAPVTTGPAVYEGYHDIANCNEILGWGWDKNRPDEPIEVEIYDGDDVIATLKADTFRQDLVTEKKGNGKHGFVYLTPPQLKDGKPHSIRVRFVGTTTDLGSTPKQINCKPGQ